MKIECIDEAAMIELGKSLPEQIKPGDLVYFSGDLGAGKTTLIRACLRQFGHEGRIPSPSYGLVEIYPFSDFQVCHLDLYRLTDAEELEFLGFRDMIDAETIILIEWPEKASDYLPPADLTVTIEIQSQGRTVNLSRAE